MIAKKIIVAEMRIALLPMIELVPVLVLGRVTHQLPPVIYRLPASYFA